MPNKVGILTSAHPPFDARIFLKECTALRDAGYRVTLVVPHCKDEQRDGIEIKALPKRKGRFRRYTWTLWDIYREAVRLRADIYHVHDPELLLVGVMLKIRTGARLIFDSHEDYPRIVLSRLWIPRPLRRIVSAFSKVVIRLTLLFFDAVVSATEEIAASIPHRKSIVVKNYSQLNLGTFENQHEPDLLVYAGTIGDERGLSHFLEAFRLIRDHVSIRLRLVGVHNDSEKAAEIGRQWPRETVEVFGWLPQPDALALISSGTIGLVMDISHEGNDGPPTKLFEYMALGLPVVGGDLPTAREIIQREGCGIVVNYRDPRETADGILSLLGDPDRLEHMRQRGFVAYKKYRWSGQAERLVDLYKSLETKSSVAWHDSMFPIRANQPPRASLRPQSGKPDGL